jgi:hypothetical protein
MKELIEKYGGTKAMVAVDLIKLHPKAAAIYGHRDIEHLSRDFQSGYPMIYNPICIGDLCIVGWRRLLAAKMAGITHVYVTVMESMPDEDIEYFIVSSNKLRVKTQKEKRREAKIFEAELPKRQGKKPLPGEEVYNQRKAIAAALGGKTSEAEVRDLLEFDDSNEHLLDTIDNKHVFLTALAAKAREGKELDLSKYVAAVPISLEPCSCPLCQSTDTARIDMVNGVLFYRT